MNPRCSFRADLFRVVRRFAEPTVGVRVEPARGGGVVLVGWSDAALMVLRDVEGFAAGPCQVRVNEAFMTGVAKTMHDVGQDRARGLHVMGVDTTIGVTPRHFHSVHCENAVFEVDGAGEWRRWVERSAFARRRAGLDLDAETLGLLESSAKALAIASGQAPQRARVSLLGGAEHCCAATFGGFEDAFVIAVAPDEAQLEVNAIGERKSAWVPPDWMQQATRVGRVETAGA